MQPEPRVVHPDELDTHVGRYPAPWDAEALAGGIDLGTAAGAERLGAWRDVIPPGRRTSRLHAHLREEEAILVVAGHPVLDWAAPGGLLQHTALRPGSWVSLPAGTGLAHSVRNPDDAAEDAVIVVVGERCPSDRLAYPGQPDFEAWRAASSPERCWPDRDGPVGSARPPAYRIETGRMVLRPLAPDDVWPLVRGVRENLDRLKPWFPWAQEVPSIDDQLGWIRGRAAAFHNDEDYTLGAFLRTGPLVGAGGLHLRQGPGVAEFGYWIVGPHEGKGLVTEWVAALTRLALGPLGFDRCVIRCDVGNHRSAAIPRRLGYTLERTETGICHEGDIVRDIQRWLLHRSDLPRSNAASAEVRAWDAAGRRLL